MTTYWWINLWFLGGVALLGAVLAVWGVRLVWGAVVIALAVVATLTAVFDNLIIGFGIVAYDPSTLSGVMVGLAPVEDFAYTLAAVVLIPLAWTLWGRIVSRGKRP